ncbi:hypothetical protein [Atopobium fossor]|uniref:hypothetical protein n=1 Tax=Atopobium fossor TaxID=39487 RepID=UPI00068479EC|nr:hypothetical protein [Atopobium fossor]
MIILPQKPVYNHALAQWILDRRSQKKSDHDFYCLSAWIKLRAHVLREFHGESQYELEQSPSLFVPANVVHHVMYVEDYPGWALSEFAVKDGEVIRNLVPLSHSAHDIAHGRFGKSQRTRKPPLTVERW